MSQKHCAKEIAAQAKYRCGYCLTQEFVIGSNMEIEHILPESLGGETIEQNLWLACNLCNVTKNDRVSARDPENSAEVSLFNPRTQIWTEHFRWNESGEQIIGITPTGRTTVAALNLNRPPLVISRQFWVKVSWHPPKD